MLKHQPIDKIAATIEADAGIKIPGLSEGLAKMWQGIAGRVYTPEQIVLRTTRNKAGKTQQAFAELIKTPVATYVIGSRADSVHQGL